MIHHNYKTEEMRTPERVERMRYVVERRQPDLTIVMENILDMHNFSAVLRSCDAVGILEVHSINTNGNVIKRLSERCSASARKWVNVLQYDSVAECYERLRKENKKIYTTHLSSEAKSLYEINFLEPVALVFGNEHDGVSEEAVALADGNVIIPQVGMIKSLNISVACAVSLYEAFRQRLKAGMYESPQLPPTELKCLFDEWIMK